jgi:hypothetical protein
MDPNTALAELRKYAIGSTSEWANFFEALDEWLMKGGFLPKDWQDAADANIAALRAALARAPRPGTSEHNRDYPRLDGVK